MEYNNDYLKNELIKAAHIMADITYVLDDKYFDGTIDKKSIIRSVSRFNHQSKNKFIKDCDINEFLNSSFDITDSNYYLKIGHHFDKRTIIVSSDIFEPIKNHINLYDNFKLINTDEETNLIIIDTRFHNLDDQDKMYCMYYIFKSVIESIMEDEYDSQYNYASTDFINTIMSFISLVKITPDTSKMENNKKFRQKLTSCPKIVEINGDTIDYLMQSIYTRDKKYGKIIENIVDNYYYEYFDN